MEKDKTLKTKLLYITGALVLLIGLCSAMLIYLAPNDDRDYLLEYENSKKYVRDLEAIGGKANVLADEFRRWFTGLWHGRPLAFIIAGSSVLVSTGIFYIASRRNPDPDQEGTTAGRSGRDAKP